MNPLVERARQLISHEKIFKRVIYLLVFVSGFIWFVAWERVGITDLLAGRSPMSDFDLYYHAALDMRQGLHPLNLPYMQTLGPPSVAIPYLPFSLLSLPLARGLMTLLNLTAIIMTGLIVSKKFWPRHRLIATVLVASLLLATFPVRFNLSQGQPNLWLMAISALLATGLSPKVAAIGSAFMMIIKTNYVVIALSWLKSKYFKIVIATIAMCTVASFTIIKPYYYRDFAQQRLGPLMFEEGKILDVDYYNQSLKSTLLRFNVEKAYIPLFVLLSLITVVYVRKNPSDFSMAIVLSLLLSPVVWQHYVVTVYPLYITLLAQKQIKTLHRLLAFIGSILVIIEIPSLHRLPVSFENSVLASHYFFGLVILAVLLFERNTQNHANATMTP